MNTTQTPDPQTPTPHPLLQHIKVTLGLRHELIEVSRYRQELAEMALTHLLAGAMMERRVPLQAEELKELITLCLKHRTSGIEVPEWSEETGMDAQITADVRVLEQDWHLMKNGQHYAQHLEHYLDHRELKDAIHFFSVGYALSAGLPRHKLMRGHLMGISFHLRHPQHNDPWRVIQEKPTTQVRVLN